MLFHRNHFFKIVLTLIFFCLNFNPLSSQNKSYNDLQVYIVVHSHADLSWPDTPEICTNLNCQAIAQSINILRDLPDFKFSEEDVFVLQEFLRRNPQRIEEVKDLLHRNILECGGFYFGPSELLLGGEGLIRNIYFGKRWLKDTFGVNAEMAWNVDEPGHTLQLPQILTKAGIKYFVIWKVLIQNDLNVSGYIGPTLFQWQAPDGSKVLVTHCPEGYGAGHQLRTDYATAEKSFQGFVQRGIDHLKEWNLPPVLLMADGSDCTIPDPRVGINARLWNETHDTPKARLASTVEYFKAAEEAVRQGKGNVQTIAGEMPCWWDGTQSVENDAFMLTRHSEDLVTTAEKFSAINDILFPGYEYPQLAINNVWQGKLSVHEHNWGGTNGIISDAVKLGRARETYRLAGDVISQTMNTLQRNIRCKNAGIPLIVFNSLTWQRLDIVDYVVSLGESGIKDLQLLDGSENEVPVQIKIQATHSDGSIARAQVIFEAEVPSLGYATYYLVPGKNKTVTSLTATPTVIENQFYKVSIDAKTGGISSIFDKMNNREIVNASKYKGNELIALENLGVDEGEELTDKWWRMGEKPAIVELMESGPIRATVRIQGTIVNSKFAQEISLYATVTRIDLKTTLNWDGQKQVQVNTVFPFGLEEPRLSYEVPFGFVEYGRENPYSKAIHPTIRGTNNWIDLSNNQMGVTLSTEVTPFDIKDRTDPRFHEARHIEGEIKEESSYMFFNPHFRNPDGTRGKLFTFNRVAFQDPVLQKTDFVIQPILLRSVYSCGDKNLYFTQQGEHTYRFSITTHKGAFVPHAAIQSGWEHNSPFVVVRGQSQSGILSDSQFFITVSEPNVVVCIFKKAEDGNGIVLRYYETDGKDTQVTIKCPAGLRKAVMTNIIEEDQNQLQINGNNLSIKIGKYAIETARLMYK